LFTTVRFKRRRPWIALSKIVSEDQFNEAVKPTSANDIRQRYEQVKAEFQVTLCRKCKNQGTAIAWDIDVTAMVRDVGDPYGTHFVACYTIPTLHIHATPASIFRHEDPLKREARNLREGDSALLNATAMLLPAIRSQNLVFGLGLDQDIEECSGDLVKLFEKYASIRS
jgi:hypothetical protein